MKANLIASSIICALLVISGCGENKPSEPESSKSPSTVALPTEANLAMITTRLNAAAFGGVDAINDVLSPKPGSTIPVKGDKLVIAGNYVDAVKGEAAAGVVVIIAGKPFIATYGGERPDIARALNNQKYLKSQFHLEIPAASIGAGIHDVKIRVIASDKSGYYESDSIAKLEIK